MPEVERDVEGREADTDESFMETARKRFAAAAEDEDEIRKEAKIDLRFAAGDQWDQKVKDDRQKAGRPAETFNRCHIFVQQVANEARQNKPQIKFIPSEDGDKDTAEIYEGLARHIQYSSDAQVAYETAVEYSAASGFGYYRFTTDYANDENDDLELKVVPVLDPSSIYGILKPSLFGMEPRHGFVVEDMPLDEYKILYPHSKISDSFAEAKGMAGDWIGTDTVRIAEYWTLEEEAVQLTTGKKRTVMRKKVTSRKINGIGILPDTETEWPGYCIPIVLVAGKQIIIDGEPQLFSVIRFQRGSQKLINAYKSRIAETLGTAPIQPYIVVDGAITGYENEWNELNVKMRPYLRVRNVSGIDNKPVPPPQRQVFEPPIQSLSEAANQEIDNQKAEAGIFDPSLGAKANETSGIAIQRRQQQSNTINMHFLDNLERAFKKGGSIIADIIPKVYDTERMIRILGADEKPKIVKINGLHKEDPNNPNERPKVYRVGGDGVGKYDVVTTMERAFSTKRMESFDMMQALLQSNPDAFPLIADIMFANSDMAGADQLSERFKKQLPPNLQDEKEGEQQIPPQVQAQMMQLKQAHDALDALSKQQQEQIKEYEAGAQVKHMEVQSRERIEQAKIEAQRTIEQLKIEAQLTIAEITTKAQEAQVRLKLEADLAKQLHVSGMDAALQTDEQDHEAAMAAMGHDVSTEEAQKDREAQATQHERDLRAQSEAQAKDLSTKEKLAAKKPKGKE